MIRFFGKTSKRKSSTISHQYDSRRISSQDQLSLLEISATTRKMRPSVIMSETPRMFSILPNLSRRETLLISVCGETELHSPMIRSMSVKILVMSIFLSPAGEDRTTISTLISVTTVSISSVAPDSEIKNIVSSINSTKKKNGKRSYRKSSNRCKMKVHGENFSIRDMPHLPITNHSEIRLVPSKKKKHSRNDSAGQIVLILLQKELRRLSPVIVSLIRSHESQMMFSSGRYSVPERGNSSRYNHSNSRCIEHFRFHSRGYILSRESR
jgi:hypothetical protein